MGRITLRLISIVRPMVKANQVVHYGTVKILFPINLKKGVTVVTKDNIGEVLSVITDYITKRPEFAEVYLYSGFVKRYRVNELNQYIIYHRNTEQFVLLSPSDYRYIFENNQPISYRLTNRHYAKLTEETKEKYKHVKTFSKTKEGMKFLRLLTHQRLEIIKKY